MAMSESNHMGWEEIERSESYLVCSMYEEAESLASSILKRLCDDKDKKDFEAGKDVEFYDMLESIGMVLVQSLKGLGRTSEILNQLKQLYVSVAAIPVQVLITGACFQISEGNSSGVREFLEEFLSKWSCVDGQYYTLVGVEANVHCMKKCDGHFILGVDEYLEVIEIYTVTVLAAVLNDLDLAVNWVEKAALPEEKRQVLLRKLHSLHSLKATNSSQMASPLLGDNRDACFSSMEEPNVSEGSLGALKANYQPKPANAAKQTVLKLSERLDPCFWWYRSITLKFGNARFVISKGKIVLGCLILLIFHVLRKKKAALKRMATSQALNLKKAFVDLWQLAFSYQVNPLAAVQPLSAPTRIGQ